jgi:hypothetical protein
MDCYPFGGSGRAIFITATTIVWLAPRRGLLGTLHFAATPERRQNARIAQLVEHITDTDGVLGSNPSARTEKHP